MEEATFLTRFADKVYVIHRRDSLRASKIMQQRAFDNEKIEFIWNSEVTAIHGDDAVTGVTLRDTVTGEERGLDLDGLFVAIGNDPRTHLVHGKLDLTPEGTIAVEGRTSKTSIAGVFAAGDVIDPNYRQAVTAAGSGTVAALDAEHYLAALGNENAAEASDRERIRRRQTRPARRHPHVAPLHQRRNAMTARAVTEATFEQEVLNNEKTVLVDFWAEWCGPCRAVSPILDQIATEHSEKLDIVKLNVDENPQLAMKYQITAIPAFKVFQAGEVVKTVIGAKPKPALEADLAAYIS